MNEAQFSEFGKSPESREPYFHRPFFRSPSGINGSVIIDASALPPAVAPQTISAVFVLVA
ncbi:hypothetical protein [Corynebacterium urogenitale]